MRTEARFPSIPATDGHYESFYLKAAAPDGGRAVWIRHTVHKRPGEEPTGAVWMTWFDADADGPIAAKQQVGADEVSVPANTYLRVGESEIAPGRMQGLVSGGGVEASWSLRFKDHSGPLHHYPSQWMYERPLPRTKVLSPHPCASFDGIVEIGDERMTLEAWPGMVGHNWGAEHADSWVWIHGATVDDDGARGYVDLAAGRIRLGPVLVPWVLNGQILHRGEQIRLGGIGRIRRTKVDAQPTRCDFTIPGEKCVARGSVSAPPERFVGWVYADPVGADHHSLNSSVADLAVDVEHSDGRRFSVQVERAATYEFGTRRTDHGIRIQPFPDG